MRTDHQPLKWLKIFQDTSSKLIRWSLKLQEFDYTVEYKKGKENVVADRLSRLPRSVTAIDQSDQMKQMQKEDEEIRELRTKTRDPQFILREGILKKRWKKNEEHPEFEQIIVPKALREEVLTRCHDDPLTGGHLGKHKTIEKVQQRYWWPGWRQDTENWIASCLSCMTKKDQPGKKPGLLQPIEVGEAFDLVGMDLIGELPETKKKNKWILVITDYLTKWIEAEPLPDAKAETIARVFVEKVLTRHAAPKRILTDQGSNFMSELFEQVNKLLGVEHSSTTAYHPQTDGLTERFNKTLMMMLSMYTSEEQDDWDEYIPYVLMAYTSSIHPATGQEPFTMLYGRTPRFPSDIVTDQIGKLDMKEEEAEKYIEQLKEKMKFMHDLARESISEAQEAYKSNYDKKREDRRFKKGEKVLVHFPVTPPGKSRKLTKKWFGPYEVTKCISPLNYEVKLVDSPKSVPLTVHIERMKKFIKRKKELEPKEGEKFEILKIVKKREILQKDGIKKTEYRVRWKGYKAKDDTWVAAEDMDTDELIAKFKKGQHTYRRRGSKSGDRLHSQ